MNGPIPARAVTGLLAEILPVVALLEQLGVLREDVQPVVAHAAPGLL